MQKLWKLASKFSESKVKGKSLEVLRKTISKYFEYPTEVLEKMISSSKALETDLKVRKSWRPTLNNSKSETKSFYS